MITAKIGKAEDLVELNRVLRKPLSYGEGDLPTYTLGPHLDQLLSVEDRQVGAPRLPFSPTLCEVSISRRRLTLTVRLDETSASSTGRLRLAAWLPDSPDFVDLGPEASRLGSTLTFKISTRRFLRDESASSEHVGDGRQQQASMGPAVAGGNKGKNDGRQPDHGPDRRVIGRRELTLKRVTLESRSAPPRADRSSLRPYERAGRPYGIVTGWWCEAVRQRTTVKPPVQPICSVTASLI